MMPGKERKVIPDVTVKVPMPDGAAVPKSNLTVEKLWEENVRLHEALEAAYLALRSYQHGNVSPDLAEEVVNSIRKLLWRRVLLARP